MNTLNATKTRTKKASNTKKASSKVNKVNEIVSAIIDPQQETKKDVQTSELLVIKDNAPKVGTYANNVLGINALGRKNTTTLAYWINDLCNLLKSDDTENVKVSIDFDGCKIFEFSEVKKDKNKNEYTQNYVLKIDSVQERLIKTIRRNSELYKIFEPLVRTTKTGKYNRFFTLQAIHKHTSYLQTELSNLLNK